MIHQGGVGVGGGVVPGNGVIGQDQQGQSVVDGAPGKPGGSHLHEGPILVAVYIGIHPQHPAIATYVHFGRIGQGYSAK